MLYLTQKEGIKIKRLLFPGRLCQRLNKSYVKSGSQAFFTNYVWLSKNGYKKYCALDLLYYKAYLVSLVYLTYRHLFGLKRNMRNSDDVAYWYNSTQALDYIKLYQELSKRWINPVEFLSMRFSSFRYQRDTYHRVYDYHVDELFNSRFLYKYYSKPRHTRFNCYYFIGNPVLDVLHVVFEYQDFPFWYSLEEMKWNWIDYTYQSRHQLRSSKLDFKGYFHHYPDNVEEAYRFDHNGYFFLLGYPEEYMAFPVISDKYRKYTCNFTKNLEGYTKHLEIPWYKLYGIHVISKEIKVLEKFSKMGSPANGFCKDDKTTDYN